MGSARRFVAGPRAICAAGLVALVGSAAAGPAGAQPILATRRVVDSVTVMQHAADAFQRAPRYQVDRTPLASMGGAAGDPAYDLTFAHYFALLGDGRLAAVAGIGNRFMLFGADGRRISVWGRTGKGPGDLMSPRGLVPYSGDTLLLADPGNERLNLVLPEQGVVGMRPLRLSREANVQRPAGLLPHGGVVMHSAGSSGMPTDTLGRTLTPLAIVSRQDDSVRRIGTLADLDVRAFETRFRGQPRRSTTTPLRFGRMAYVVVWDTLIATAIGERYEVRLLNDAGKVVSRLAVPIGRRVVTQAMRDAQIAVEVERFNAQGGGERMVHPAESKRHLYERPFADSLPPHGDLFVTPNRTLWVIDAIAPGDTAWSATAFRVDGAITSRLRVSGRSQPVAFGDDRVVVREVDEDGVVTLRVFRIRPADTG